ncbi:hypothetical protein BpHYR1_017662 [Brachionus plicatilis]|uniref:Uncharacterized protein n=1 Tax=Brachionus plicatilis TaxID=10195 RepID=A0A3M7RA33_BRAPC|nr:hypothetical protein BpHYR1_017662 [Brachionus plicatilis]
MNTKVRTHVFVNDVDNDMEHLYRTATKNCFYFVLINFILKKSNIYIFIIIVVVLSITTTPTLFNLHRYNREPLDPNRSGKNYSSGFKVYNIIKKIISPGKAIKTNVVNYMMDDLFLHEKRC